MNDARREGPGVQVLVCGDDVGEGINNGRGDVLSRAQCSGVSVFLKMKSKTFEVCSLCRSPNIHVFVFFIRPT